MKFPTFKSGIHPEESKYFTESLAIETLPMPKEVFIPLQQHIGAPCKPVVEVKDEVIIGQVIGSTEAYVSSPVHATISEASNILLKLSFLQYGLPLIGFLLGIIIATQLNINLQPVELYQFIYGLLGLGLAGLISYLIIKRMAKKLERLFQIERR